MDEKRILRKGAVSADKDEDVVIPINMKDGIILGRGKGNPEWNCSAPHGAGRVIRKSDVEKHFTVSQFKKEIRGVHFSMSGRAALAEAPFAYRGLEELRSAVSDTVEVKKVLRPVYNYKPGERR